MPHFTDITGLAGVASAMAAALLLLPGAVRMRKPRLAMLLVVAFVLVLVTFGGMPLAAYVRGATGDLSITTLVLLWGALSSALRGQTYALARPVEMRGLLVLVMIVAVIFYPLALGAGMFDPYRLGYGEPIFLATLLLIVLAAWFKEYYLVVLCIALATLAWAIGWYESGNLWDYLLDPFLAIYAMGVLIIQAARKIRVGGS